MIIRWDRRALKDENFSILYVILFQEWFEIYFVLGCMILRAGNIN